MRRADKLREELNIGDLIKWLDNTNVLFEVVDTCYDECCIVAKYYSHNYEPFGRARSEWLSWERIAECYDGKAPHPNSREACPECKGTGQVMLFNVYSKCKACA